MTTVATFTDNKGVFVFDAVSFGDAMMAAGTVTNKTQIRSMVRELSDYIRPQTVTVAIVCKKMWVSVLNRKGVAYSFSVGVRGAATFHSVVE